MQPTLHELLETRRQHLLEVDELETRIRLEQQEAHNQFVEIHNRFCPNHWVGHEFTLVNAETLQYPMCTKDLMEEGKLPFQRWRVPNLQRTQVGGLFKATNVYLKDISNLGSDSLYLLWVVQCRAKLKSTGEWGKQTFDFIFVDKVESEK